MYPEALPNNDKAVWTHVDCFSKNPNILVQGFTHKNYRINMHAHDFYELNLVLKGKGIHYINHNSFPIEAGDLFIIPPGFKHGYYMLEELDVYHLLINNRFFAKYRNELEFLPGYLMLLTVEPAFRKDMNFRYFLKLEPENEKYITQYLLRLQEGYGQEGIETPVLAHSLALHVVAQICKLYREQYRIQEDIQRANPFFSCIIESMDFIEKNYSGKITIEDLLKNSHLSRSTFLRLFTRVTGYTPGDYISRYRVGKATELLLYRDMSVAEVAQSVGFYDSSHFVRLFKKHTGYTPREYRDTME